MQNFFESNKKIWNDRVAVHAKSDFYDVESFKKGKSSLNFIELEELGDVTGKTLLHLQCHFGMDTLSWTRLGAKTTGVDFSDKAIILAKELNDELKLDSEFICSNVYDLKEVLNKKYDIVFTSYGVIGWLPDIAKWADIVSHFLKPGGVFCMVEFHPVFWMLDEKFEHLKYSYFNIEPIVNEADTTYADRTAEMSGTEYGWNHPFSDVFSSLLKCGLRIESFREFPFSVYDCFPNTVKGDDGWWRIKGLENRIPMMYSLKCIKK
ncbi:MAG: class I SAM-dependent methyltransferase [Ignavibacteriaceae bacterium]